MTEAVVLAFGLAMDATAVAAARGMAGRAAREAIALPLLFGAFQAGMAALGWALGAWGGRYVAAFDHWIAFGLLVLIGAKMLFGHHDGEARPPGIAVWLVLAVATSIDAAAAGITLPLMPVAPWLALAMIGAITWACAQAGYLAGRAIRSRVLERAGGVILIALGVKILVEHLWW